MRAEHSHQMALLTSGCAPARTMAAPLKTVQAAVDKAKAAGGGVVPAVGETVISLTVIPIKTLTTGTGGV